MNLSEFDKIICKLEIVLQLLILNQLTPYLKSSKSLNR